MRTTKRQLRRIIREVFAATAGEEAEKVNAQTGISLVTDQAFWEEMGVSTGEELAKSLLSSTYSDYYKEIHGIRPRWNMERIRAMSVEEIQAEVDKLDDEAAELAKDPPHEWMEDRDHEDQEGWEDEMIAAVKAHPEDVPEEYIEYETLPQQTGMGRRTEGIMRITRRQLRRIIKEAIEEEVFWKEGDLVHKVDYYGTGYGEDYKKTVGDQAGQVIEIDKDIDGTQYTVLFADGSTIMDTGDSFEAAK
jgi:hypothetical protein